MKESQFNFYYAINSNEYLIYNSFTNALASIDEKRYRYVFADKSYNLLSEEEIEFFREGGFLIDDQYDEKVILKDRLYSARYSSGSLGLTIAPTLDCNFRCTYCYEKDVRYCGVMGENVQSQILDYVKSRAGDISKLMISWYGGEPLLALDVISDLSKKFMSLASENNFEYLASIVTNGYLLSEEVAQKLVDCGIYSCQITLDGDREQHDSRRFLAGGQRTFDEIIKNINIASKYLRAVNVRVNTDKSNVDAFLSVKNYLRGIESDNVFVYPAPVKSQEDCYNEGLCFTNKEFSEIETSYLDMLSEKEKRESVMKQYPKLRGNVCCADRANSFVIAPNGDMYKCWSDIGRKDRLCGNLLDGQYNIMNCLRYSKYCCVDDEKCSSCKFLPICMGGCPYERENTNADRCVYYDEFHERILRETARFFGENAME